MLESWQMWGQLLPSGYGRKTIICGSGLFPDHALVHVLPYLKLCLLPCIQRLYMVLIHHVVPLTSTLYMSNF